MAAHRDPTKPHSRLERTAYMRAWRDKPGNRQKHNRWSALYRQTPRGKLEHSVREQLAKREQRDPIVKEYALVLMSDPCSYCDEPAGSLDHIEAVSKGGSSEWENLTAACRSCNSRKHNKSLLDFLGSR